MDMPTVTETTVPTRSSGPAPSKERAADAARGGRPQLTEQVVHGSAIDRPDRPHGRDGAATHVHVHGGTANRILSKSAQTMLENLDKHGDVRGASEGKPDREGTSTAGITVVETAGAPAASGDADKPAETGDAPSEQPAASDTPATSEPAKAAAAPAPEKPAEPAADPKLTAEIDRLQAHNRKLVSELEARSGAPVLDDRHKALDEIERMAIESPIDALERLFTLAIGAKDAKDPAVQRFLAGVYGDWTERELKVPMDRAARAEFGTERNKHLIDRDRRDRSSGETTAAEKSKAAERERTVRDTVSTLDRQLVESKHGDKFPHLMKSELLDGITPGQRLFTAIAQGLAAGDWDKVPPDDKLVEHYSAKIDKEYQTRDQKLRAHYAPAPTTSTATPTPASEPVKDKAADAPSKEVQAGARTITNASASVAPSTPPKEAAAPPAKDKPPTFRNEAERRQYLARKWFDEAGADR
jgi:hypothetical protein